MSSYRILYTSDMESTDHLLLKINNFNNFYVV